MTKRKTVIGLTGPSGAGKSTAAAVFKQHGFYCIDCDAVCRHVYDTNPLCVAQLVKAFGQDILTHGKINRRALATVAFADEEHKQQLNDMVLPFIDEEILRQIEENDSDRILLDAPTLFESGLDEICMAVVALLCDRTLCRTRIISRDSLSETQADSRLSVGQPDEFYTDRTNYVVYNNATKQELAESVSAMLIKLMKEIES